MSVTRGARWALITSDCVDAMKRMRSESVDAVVTDPPYGLGAPPPMEDVLRAWLAGERYHAKGPGFMGKEWDAFVPGPEVWREALRVLKPGGHLLAFFGARTFDLGALAIRLAGFEVRDTLSWLYGSGFPKSLDVSAAIDKQRQDDPRPVCRFLRVAMDARGLSARQVAEHFGFHSRMVDHWAARDTDSQPTVPTVEQWEQLRSLLRFGSDMDAEVYRLNTRKGTPGEAWQEAPVAGQQTKARTAAGNSALPTLGADVVYKTWDVKAANSNAARQWDGWGTALKPAWEPIILARKPLVGTVAANVLQHGTGALNVDGCRVASEEDRPLRVSDRRSGNNTYADGLQGSKAAGTTSLGRWPANVLLNEHAAELLDAQTGVPKSGARMARGGPGRYSGSMGGGKLGDTTSCEASEGGASRFFYVAKASRSERDAGCESLPERTGGEATGREDGSAGTNSPRAGAGRTGGARNTHPTVKPVELMRWLCRLVTPPGGLVLDPFTGSGSTGIAALREGFRFVGVEQSEEYAEIARCRLTGETP